MGGFLITSSKIAARRLLLEQVLELLAGVVGTRVGRWCRAIGRRWLRVRRGRGVFLDGCAEFVEFATVLDVFRRDALEDWLHTFKLGAGIEKAALLAGMQLETALGTLTVRVEAGREDDAAIRAASARDRADMRGVRGPN